MERLLFLTINQVYDGINDGFRILAPLQCEDLRVICRICTKNIIVSTRTRCGCELTGFFSVSSAFNKYKYNSKLNLLRAWTYAENESSTFSFPPSLNADVLVSARLICFCCQRVSRTVSATSKQRSLTGWFLLIFNNFIISSPGPIIKSVRLCVVSLGATIRFASENYARTCVFIFHVRSFLW